MFSSRSFWTSSSLDVPAGVTQEEGHTGTYYILHTAEYVVQQTFSPLCEMLRGSNIDVFRFSPRFRDINFTKNTGSNAVDIIFLAPVDDEYLSPVSKSNQWYNIQ